ncbi:unnamed protein product [Protopolystoma xenopodis]|uniref:Uncharacterized protein n=1 Tax=Protopolystoma xenopodis TaxID=117903 RepID=A0A3S5FE64_9PLAT|nr:unnamed protein product [Protopolystoma xenopodis]
MNPSQPRNVSLQGFQNLQQQTSSSGHVSTFDIFSFLLHHLSLPHSPSYTFHFPHFPLHSPLSPSFRPVALQLADTAGRYGRHGHHGEACLCAGLRCGPCRGLL